MYKGFYNLTSGMLTQQRNLNVVGNNLVNISTAGFKESRYTATTFDDVMYSRVGNKEKVYTEIGRQSYIRAEFLPFLVDRLTDRAGDLIFLKRLIGTHRNSDVVTAGHNELFHVVKNLLGKFLLIPCAKRR